MMNVLIFDYDGVISDSIEAYIELFNRIHHKYSLPRINSREDWHEFFEDNFYDAAVRKGLPKEKIPELMEESRREMEGKPLPLFDGIKETLGRLSEKNIICIVTSNITKNVKDNIERNGIHGIEVLGADKELSKVKKILSIKKQFPDARIYFIGDTAGDIKEGREAGVKTVAVTWGLHPKKKLEKEQPDIIVYSIEALEKIFSN